MRTTEDLQRRATAVATFEGGKLTVGEVEDAIGIVAPHSLSREVEWDSVQEKYAQLLRTKLYEVEALRRGYDKNDRVVIRIQQLGSDLMVSQLVNEPLEKYQPPAEELAEFFQSHQEQLGAPELRRVFELVVATEAEARALVPQVKAASDAALRELIKSKSIDAESRDDGYSRYFDHNGLLDDKSASVDPALAKATYALSGIGANSDVVALKEHYAILRLAALRPAYTPTLQQATPTARKLIIDERREQGRTQLVDEARKHFPPVVHEELLKQLPAEIPAADTSH